MREQLESCWRAAVAAVDAGAAVTRALAHTAPRKQPLHLLAFGKAAPAMAEAATAWLTAHGRSPAGGVVIGPDEDSIRRAAGHTVPLEQSWGDHPVPAAASYRAAEAVARAVSAVGPGDAAMVLLSGGTSSLIAAPIPGLSDSDLRRLWRLLLDSGLDIHAMNAVRRHFTRWSGGRLALALSGRPVDVLAISDVPGDDPASIGSGPCSADPFTAPEIERLLEEAGLFAELPPSLAAMLRGTRPLAPTAQPGDGALADVHTRVIASNEDAVRAAADRARSLDWHVQIRPEPLTGDAAAAGAFLAEQLVGAVTESPSEPRCIVSGGETTVSLGSSAPVGGRCQELALAAARVLRRADAGARVALLAAGTDGRDGPTDAAGAVVDGETWRRICAAGRDPDADLASHDSYRALNAAGALFRTGSTGTNVMDLVIGVRVPAGWNSSAANPDVRQG